MRCAEGSSRGGRQHGGRGGGALPVGFSSRSMQRKCSPGRYRQHRGGQPGTPAQGGCTDHALAPTWGRSPRPGHRLTELSRPDRQASRRPRHTRQRVLGRALTTPSTAQELFSLGKGDTPRVSRESQLQSRPFHLVRPDAAGQARPAARVLSRCTAEAPRSSDRHAAPGADSGRAATACRTPSAPSTARRGPDRAATA